MPIEIGYVGAEKKVSHQGVHQGPPMGLGKWGYTFPFPIPVPPSYDARKGSHDSNCRIIYYVNLAFYHIAARLSPLIGTECNARLLKYPLVRRQCTRAL